MPGRGDVGQIHRELGVLDPSGDAGVLTLHTNGLVAALEVAGFVDHQDGIVVAQVITDVGAQVVPDTVGIPTDAAFATKPALAIGMITAAPDAGVPASWVAGDEVYGADPTLRSTLQGRGVGYVWAVASNRRIPVGKGWRRVDELTVESAARLVGDVATVLVQSPLVEPGDLLGGGGRDGVGAAPGLAVTDHRDFVQVFVASARALSSTSPTLLTDAAMPTSARCYWCPDVNSCGEFAQTEGLDPGGACRPAA